VRHDPFVPSAWFSVVVDCEDPARLAAFWCGVLGYTVVYESSDIVDITSDEATLPGIEFVRAESHERRKSPLHIDLNPDDQDAEVARLLALGAHRVDVGQPEGASWVVLADPEGNAFCVLARQAGWSSGPV
jgi:predicted enzyme related to lactoylglutathione lyase